MSLTKRVTLSVVLAVVLAALGWWGCYRATYQTFAFWEAPPEFSYCGWDYEAYPDTTVSTLPHGSTYTLVDTIEPGGWKIYAVDLKSKQDSHGDSCAALMYLERGSHEYVGYELLGGP